MANPVIKIPTIQISAPAPVPVQKPKPPSLWVILAVVAGVILLAGK